MKTILITLFIIFCLLFHISAKADFAKDGTDGFMQHWRNLNAAMQVFENENAAMQEDLNDNSQEAQDLLANHPELSQQISSAETQLSPAVSANPVGGLAQSVNAT